MSYARRKASRTRPLLIGLLFCTAGLFGQEWTTYGGNHAGWRYSALAGINTANVAGLSPQWIFQTRVPGNIETTPLVMEGLMYVTAASNHAFALDARTGRPIWHYAKTPPSPLNLCCGEVNRGFAAIGDKLFKVNIEDTLVALDRASGKVLWETQIADHRKGYSGTAGAARGEEPRDRGNGRRGVRHPRVCRRL